MNLLATRKVTATEPFRHRDHLRKLDYSIFGNNDVTEHDPIETEADAEAADEPANFNHP
jgi:hypothetical protein